MSQVKYCNLPVIHTEFVPTIIANSSKNGNALFAAFLATFVVTFLLKWRKFQEKLHLNGFF
jgi:hypothetical protein